MYAFFAELVDGHSTIAAYGRTARFEAECGAGLAHPQPRNLPLGIYPLITQRSDLYLLGNISLLV